MLFDLKRPATWILPVVSLCLGNLSFYALWLRRYILEERGKDYVTFARAKGAGSVRVGFCHIFRNGIVPLVQFLPGSVMATLMGTIYVESLFSVPGMGGLLIQVIKMQDNTMVQALVLLYSALSMAGLFLGDLLMAFLDPRIRVRGMGGKEPCV